MSKTSIECKYTSNLQTLYYIIVPFYVAKKPLCSPGWECNSISNLSGDMKSMSLTGSFLSLEKCSFEEKKTERVLVPCIFFFDMLSSKNTETLYLKLHKISDDTKYYAKKNEIYARVSNNLTIVMRPLQTKCYKGNERKREKTHLHIIEYTKAAKSLFEHPLAWILYHVLDSLDENMKTENVIMVRKNKKRGKSWSFSDFYNILYKYYLNN